jgi:hypothetical protein
MPVVSKGTVMYNYQEKLPAPIALLELLYELKTLVSLLRLTMSKFFLTYGDSHLS